MIDVSLHSSAISPVRTPFFPELVVLGRKIGKIDQVDKTKVLVFTSPPFVRSPMATGGQHQTRLHDLLKEKDVSTS